jgi:adenylate kinase
LLREEIATESGLGRKAREFVETGALVPDEIVLQIIGVRLKKSDAGVGFVLDGFPRTVPQAKALDELLSASPLEAVICFRISEEALLERLAGRRTCSSCGTNFHTRFAPPKRSEACDQCGGRLIRRDDDQEVAIQKRLEVYRKGAEALASYYRGRGLLREVNAAGSPGEVGKSVLSAIGEADLT